MNDFHYPPQLNLPQSHWPEAEAQADLFSWQEEYERPAIQRKFLG
jgi:hypothetical protein